MSYYPEFWVECKQEGLASSIEMVAWFQFTGCQCTKDLKDKNTKLLKKKQEVTVLTVQ